MNSKILNTVVKSIEEESRAITFVMSSEDVDRDNDVIKVDGWELDNFLKNPVFLVFHDRQQFPIGKVLEMKAADGKLYGTVKFADKGTYQVADIAYELYKQGIMNAVSVSFAGKEYEPNEHGGMTFTKQELFELSAVPVPANPAAVAVAKGLNAQVDALFCGQEQANAKLDESKEAERLVKETINILRGILHGRN